MFVGLPHGMVIGGDSGMLAKVDWGRLAATRARGRRPDERKTNAAVTASIDELVYTEAVILTSAGLETLLKSMETLEMTMADVVALSCSHTLAYTTRSVMADEKGILQSYGGRVDAEMYGGWTGPMMADAIPRHAALCWQNESL